MARLSIGVSADAKEASSEFKALAEDIKKVGTESVGVTEGVARVDAALAKLANAPDTPMALARATAKAKLEIDELRAALEKTPASAEAMKSIGAALAKADQALESTIKRAGKLGEAQEEVKQRMGLTAKGAESLGNSFGSLDGIMGKMADSSSATSQAVAKLGFSVVAAGQAFKLGYETGEQFRKGLQAIGVTVPDLSDKMAKLVLATEELVRGYEKAELVESAAMNRARQIIALKEAQAVAERALASAQAAAGVEWKNADAERQKVVDKLNAVEQILSRATKSEAEYGATIKANGPLLLELAKASGEHEIALSKVAPRTAAAAAEAQKLADAEKKVSDSTPAATRALTEQEAAMAAVQAELAKTAAAYDQVAEATNRRRAAEDAAANRTSKAPAEFKAIQDAAFGAAVASGELGTNLDNVAKAVVATGGTMTVGPPMFIQYAQATKEATQALLDFALASKAVREEQAEAMQVTKGWTDYVLTLKEGYESGITSLYNYVTALGAFKTQLQQMFGAAHGEAKDALEGMIQLIEKLMQTAGAGGNGQFGTPDFSPIRQLEREFGQ
jgi:hypothetical protein